MLLTIDRQPEHEPINTSARHAFLPLLACIDIRVCVNTSALMSGADQGTRTNSVRRGRWGYPLATPTHQNGGKGSSDRG
jgi:hypothetical protein